MYWPNGPFIVFDTETTGLDFATDRIIEVSIAVFNGGQYIHGFNWLSNTEKPSNPDAVAVHGITDEHRWEFGRPPRDIFREVYGLLNRMRKQKKPVMAFNAPFDFTMLGMELFRQHYLFTVEDFRVIDPLVIDRHFETHIPVFTKPYMRLEQMAKRYCVSAPTHRALDDAKATGEVAIAQSLHHSQIRHMSPLQLHREQEKWYHQWCLRVGEFAAKKQIQFNILPWPFGMSPTVTRSGCLDGITALYAQQGTLTGVPVDSTADTGGAED